MTLSKQVITAKGNVEQDRPLFGFTTAQGSAQDVATIVATPEGTQKVIHLPHSLPRYDFGVVRCAQ
jgi:hypothetical protein